MSRQGRSLALIAVFAGLLAVPASSSAVTLGSNLQRAPSIGVVGCGGAGCTFGLYSMDSPSLAAPGGVVSQINGTVTGWRIRSGSQSNSTTLRIVRPLGSNLFTGAGTSAAQTPPTDSISPTYPAQLPIQIGDLLGIQCCAGGISGVYFRVGEGDTHQWFAPGLSNGGAGEAPDDFEGELALQADVDVTNAFTAKVKSRPNGKLKVSATLPNPGLFSVGDKKPSGTSAVASAKSLVTRGRAQPGAPGDVLVKLKANNKGRQVLAEKGKAKVKLLLTYTPTFGITLTKKVKVKLKD